MRRLLHVAAWVVAAAVVIAVAGFVAFSQARTSTAGSLRSEQPLRIPPPDFPHERFSGGDDTLDLLELRAALRLRSSPELPKRVSAGDGPGRRMERTRRFELSGSRRINGRTMAMARVDAVVEPGALEAWTVADGGSFHVHGVRFQLVEYAGARPPARSPVPGTPSTYRRTAPCGSP